jgi:hypothetical protein
MISFQLFNRIGVGGGAASSTEIQGLIVEIEIVFKLTLITLI